jgi:sugar/nucleoside kinase (ribokinase family)
MQSVAPHPNVKRKPAASIIGNVNADVIARPAGKLPPPGAEWQLEHAELRVGGAAANAALALAALGAQPRLVGCVGGDPLGRLLLAELAGSGVATEDVASLDGLPTGLSLAFEAEGRDRSFLTSLGSLARFDRSLVPASCLQAPFVLSCGYFLLPALRGSGTRRLLEEARAGGATVLFDPGWDTAGFAPETRKELEPLLPLVDVLLPNEAEALGLAGVDDLDEAARALRSSAGWVVVKRGRDGCLAVGPAGEAFRTDAPRVDVVDTTGAGDAFNAGLVFELARGSAYRPAIEFATRLASAVVARPSSDRYPTLEDVHPAGDRKRT